MATFKFHLFGHSFPKRLFKYIRETDQTVTGVVNPPDSCELFLDGNSGLTYAKISSEPNRFLSRIRRNNGTQAIDVLIIDMGTNELCDPEVTVPEVVQSALSLIDQLQHEDIRPKFIVHLSVIQRTYITRPNQVSVTCFNRRAKKFNRILSQECNTKFDNVFMFAQNRINFPRYCGDGVHFNAEGRRKYCLSLRRLMTTYRQQLYSMSS
jgi:lysophospholipase L1-like esterase